MVVAGLDNGRGCQQPQAYQVGAKGHFRGTHLEQGAWYRGSRCCWLWPRATSAIIDSLSHFSCWEPSFACLIGAGGRTYGNRCCWHRPCATSTVIDSPSLFSWEPSFAGLIIAGSRSRCWHRPRATSTAISWEWSFADISAGRKRLALGRWHLFSASSLWPIPGATAVRVAGLQAGVVESGRWRATVQRFWHAGQSCFTFLFSRSALCKQLVRRRFVSPRIGFIFAFPHAGNFYKLPASLCMYDAPSRRAGYSLFCIVPCVCHCFLFRDLSRANRVGIASMPFAFACTVYTC